MSELTTFAGRVEELQILYKRLARAREREPQLVVVEGASGSGKSTLLREFSRRLEERSNEIAVVAVSPPAEGTYDPVRLAAREATRNQLYERVGGRRKAMESARELLPDWLGAIPVIGELISAIVATIQTLQRRRRKQVVSPISGDDDTDALIAASTRRPVVLMLDGLEAVDRAAAARLEALLRAAAGRSQLLVIGACRSTAPGTRPPPIYAMASALPAPVLCRLELRELSTQELAGWLHKRFPHVQIPESFLEWLGSSTGGHPAAVDAMLDRLISRSVIHFVNRRWEIAHTPTEMDVVPGVALGVDLSGLKPATLQMLEAASLLGVEFDSLSLAQLSERDELYVEDQLAHAVRHELIDVGGEVAVQDDIATRYRFRSVHLRSSLLHALSAERRAQLARRQAELAATI